MSFDGSNRVALITGASRGIGRALALGLAERGCAIAVAAKTMEPHATLPGTVPEVCAEVEARGARALGVQVDVRDERSIAEAVDRTLQHFGRIDFLINNAGALFWKPLHETPAKRFDLVMDVNARGAFLCTHAVLPAMLQQRFGHILFLSPPVDPTAAAGKIAYAISKFGMTLIAHGLAGEVRDHNIAANALWPATMIDSLATRTWGLGEPRLWRTPQILVDATLRLFAKEPRNFTGHALIDEDFLRSEGWTDFTKYRCDPAFEPPRIGFDFHIEAGDPSTKLGA